MASLNDDSTELGASLLSQARECAVPKVNLEAHEGLRGAAACWVMLFHCFLRSTDPIDFQGSSLMPLFFLLSGFTLSVVYGDLSPDKDRGFVRNRLVRVSPVYLLLSFAVSLPLWLQGFGDAAPTYTQALVGSVVTTLTFTSTAFCFLLGSPLDGPSWTVQTLLVMWLFFPLAMRRARGMPTDSLATWIVSLYWLQLALIFVLFFVLFPFAGFWPAFAAATMNPVSRLPVFLMGVCAGELCRRGEVGSVWPRGFVLPFVCCSSSLATAAKMNISNDTSLDEEGWTARAFWQATGLLCVTLLVAVVDKTVQSSGLSSVGIVGAVWFQALVPFAQLELVVALTQHRGTSLLHRLLTTDMAKFLGRISMTVYLLHYQVIYFFCFALHGFQPLSWPTGSSRSPAGQEGNTDDAVGTWARARELPLWCVPVVAVVSIGVATMIFYFFEEPIRRKLRS